MTSTALDYITWSNELPPGRDVSDGIEVLRFPVAQQRSAYWHALHARLLQSTVDRKRGDLNLVGPTAGWSFALQHEFIAKQGPYCPDLLIYLRNYARSFDCLVFITYLYPTTFFGREAIGDHPRTVLIPTLHDEPPAYLSAFRRMAHRFDLLLWNSEAERAFSRRLWGELPGAVVGMSVEGPLSEYERQSPYFLYCGRLDPNKGGEKMINYFRELKRRRPSPLRLILTGALSMELPEDPDIQFLGFVSVEDRRRLMRNATAFIMPSPFESFSIVTLEALEQQTPVLANIESEVVASHVIQSGGGIMFCNAAGFIRSAQQLLENEKLREEMGMRGRAYVQAHFSTHAIQRRLLDALELTDSRQSSNAKQPRLAAHSQA